jgi:hypothetical protein
MSDYEGITPEAAVLATMHRHLTFLKQGLMRIRHDLEQRGLMHDESKFSTNEFPGFTRINATAREHPYGSKEYKDSLSAERATIDHHTSHNSHHPEFFDKPSDMGWLDIIEMVCDWSAANRAYGNTSWTKSLEINKNRFNFTEQQWWLIEQVARFLEEV